jgi:hypothetical protein
MAIVYVISVMMMGWRSRESKGYSNCEWRKVDSGGADGGPEMMPWR